jgi:nitroreductase
MHLSKLLINRRSIRNYQDKVVPLETIHSIINDSILAPSSGNGQPWKFIIVNNKEMIEKISDEGKKTMLERIASNPNDYAKIYESMLQKEAFHIFYHAPSVVFIIGETNQKNLYADCALAASYFMMSATARGLGTCWVNFARAIKDPEMLMELGIADNHTIVAPIALGYPVKIPAIPRRKEAEIIKVIH